MKNKRNIPWKAAAILILVLMLCLSLCACDEGTDSQQEIEMPSNSEVTAVDAPENDELYINIPYQQAEVESFVNKIIQAMDANAELIYDEDEGGYIYKYEYGYEPCFKCELWVQRPGHQKQKIELFFLEDSFGLSHEVRRIVLEEYDDGKTELIVVAKTIELLVFGYTEVHGAFASCEYDDSFEYQISKMLEEEDYNCKCFVERRSTRNKYSIRYISPDNG